MNCHSVRHISGRCIDTAYVKLYGSGIDAWIAWKTMSSFWNLVILAMASEVKTVKMTAWGVTRIWTRMQIGKLQPFFMPIVALPVIMETRHKYFLVADFQGAWTMSFAVSDARSLRLKLAILEKIWHVFLYKILSRTLKILLSIQWDNSIMLDSSELATWNIFIQNFSWLNAPMFSSSDYSTDMISRASVMVYPM